VTPQDALDLISSMGWTALDCRSGEFVETAGGWIAWSGVPYYEPVVVKDVAIPPRKAWCVRVMVDGDLSCGRLAFDTEEEAHACRATILLCR